MLFFIVLRYRPGPTLGSTLRDPSLLSARTLIGGAWETSGELGTLEVVDPATGEALACVPKRGRPYRGAACGPEPRTVGNELLVQRTP